MEEAFWPATSNATTTKCWAWRAAPMSRRSRAPTANWRCSFIPTAIRTIPTRKKNSRKPAKPTPILADQRKARRSTTVLATAACHNGGGGCGSLAARVPGFQRHFRRFFWLRRNLWRRVRRRTAQPGATRRRSARGPDPGIRRSGLWHREQGHQCAATKPAKAAAVSGAAAGKAPASLPPCNGHGQVRYQQGFFSMARTCPTCQGAGTMIEHPCPKCKGAAREPHSIRWRRRFLPGSRTARASCTPGMARRAARRTGGRPLRRAAREGAFRSSSAKARTCTA